MKKCTKCLETKPLEEFRTVKSRNWAGPRGNCKACDIARYKAYRLANKPKMAASMREYRKRRKDVFWKAHLKRSYGITPQEHVKLAQAQGNQCAICRKEPTNKRPLVIDHNHETGVVRGLLCYGCNRAISILDKPELLAKAAKYLGHRIGDPD